MLAAMISMRRLAFSILAVLGGVSAGWAAGCTTSSSSPGPLTCPAGATMCGGWCSSVETDPDNCGACGHTCSALQICDLGVCTTGVGDAMPRAEAGGDAQADAPSFDGAPREANADAPGDARSDSTPDASSD